MTCQACTCHQGTDLDTRLCCLVSDDTHPNTLARAGHIDHILRRAVEKESTL
ncbi:MAG: hypothetical protein ACLTQI_04475 [Slackia sp.]